jgi:hypothetical protein
MTTFIWDIRSCAAQNRQLGRAQAFIGRHAAGREHG